MIRSFRDRETEKLFLRIPSRKWRAIERSARVKLALLHAARELTDLSLPGLHLEKLRGDRKGEYSIRVNDQFRICFEWRTDGAYRVELVDYH